MQKYNIDRYTLRGTPAENDYNGGGWAACIFRDGIPSALIYLPECGADKPFEEVMADVDFSAINWEDNDARARMGVYVGVCSNTVRCIDIYAELGKADYKAVSYEDAEIVIEHITDDLYITGYKTERQRLAVRLTEKDFNGVARWSFNFKERAEIFVRYIKDDRGRWEIVRLLDKKSEIAHVLESRDNGSYSEDGSPFGWCAAALEAYDTDGEFVQAYTLGYISEFDAKRWTY